MRVWRGAIWVIFPKKVAAGRLCFNASIAEMISAVASLGLIGNKTCAVNTGFTSTRFCIRRELRSKLKPRLSSCFPVLSPRI